MKKSTTKQEDRLPVVIKEAHKVAQKLLAEHSHRPLHTLLDLTAQRLATARTAREFERCAVLAMGVMVAVLNEFDMLDSTLADIDPDVSAAVVRPVLEVLQMGGRAAVH